MATLSKEKAREILKLTFRDLTLCLGGVFLVHRVKDDLIWIILKSVEEIYDNALKSLKEIGSDGSEEDFSGDAELKPHPAIERFLARLERKERKRR